VVVVDAGDDAVDDRVAAGQVRAYGVVEADRFYPPVPVGELLDPVGDPPEIAGIGQDSIRAAMPAGASSSDHNSTTVQAVAAIPRGAGPRSGADVVVTTNPLSASA